MRKIIFPLLLLLAACTSKSDKNEPRFFDLKGFASQYADSLKGAHPVCEKKVTLNGISDSSTQQDISWEDDLRLLKEFDINKPSWRTSFKETKELRNGITWLHYKALDTHTQVQQLDIGFLPSGRVKEIHGLRKSSNLLYGIDQEVNLITDSLYELTSKQHIWIMGDKNYHLQTRFVY